MSTKVTEFVSPVTKSLDQSDGGKQKKMQRKET